MPITRSMGRAPKAWMVELHEEEPPRPPSPTTELVEQTAEPPAPPAPPLTEQVQDQTVYRRERSNATQTLRATTATRLAPSHITEEIHEPIKQRAVQSVVSARSNRKVQKAREEILKIKLQLAQIALEKAEEEAESDGYEIDEQSKAEYVRSWLADAPEPQPHPTLVTTEATADVAAEAPMKGTTREQKTVSVKENTDEETSKKKETSPQGSDPLTQLITGLTSTIAALAEKPLEMSHTSPHPAVSKVIMTLPTFDGAHTEWLSFRAIYDTTKKYFNDVENTARLRKSLKGRALETVNSELIGNARPADIMQELELQFGRPDAIAQTETEKLKHLPRCGEAPRDICTFAGRIRSGIVTLEAIKKEHYLINAELLRVLTEKLPNSLRVQWYRTYTEKYASVPDLRRFSDFVTEHAQFCSAFAPAEGTREPPHNRRMPHRTYNIIEKRMWNPNSASHSKCKICGQEGHYSADCDTFRRGDSDRRWELAKKHGLCFRCLRARHQQHMCKAKKCGIEGCTASHNQLLHYRKPKTEDSKTEKQETVANSSLYNDRQAFLKIIPVQLVGPAGEISTFALLDDGSTVSLIDEEIAQAVGAEGKVDPFTIRTIGDKAIEMPASQRIEVTLKTPTGKQTPLRARTVSHLRLTPQRVTEEDIADCRHLEDIRDQLVYHTGLPKILIGQDNWHLLVASIVRRGPQHQPVASLTQLGWVLHGAHTRTIGQKVHFVGQMSAEENIDKQLKQYFALESLIVNPLRPKTDPEKIAEDILEKSTRQLEDKHIETALLWKTEKIEMPDSYENAMKRLTSIERKLDRSPALKLKYTEQMESLIEKGYAEEAPQGSTPGKTWYLPHFDVHNPMKPEKIRIVHDAAAKSKGVSLNDHLLTGPDLLQSLPGVMMRFRRHSIAVSADIAEMFMQVRIREEDRDALRYLWRGNRREGAPKEYRMKSLIFGAASSPCTAIFAKNWNARKHINEHPEAVEAIIDNHYMDDYLDSFRDELTASSTARLIRNIHKEACFELRKWVSNSSKVVQEIEPSQENIETVNLMNREQKEKILGLIWQPSTDELSFNLELARLPNNLVSKATPTRREDLLITMSSWTEKKSQEDPDWRSTMTRKKNTSGSAAPRLATDSRHFVFLPAEHTYDAEDLLVKAVQEDSFDAELRELRSGRGVARNSRLYPLSTEYSEGIITLRSRTTVIDTEMMKRKKPPILDGDHRITHLYIDWTHRKLHHSGTELIINEIRQHYWVLRLRPTAKKIIHQCLQCRIRKTRPPEPATSDLPMARLAHHQRAFTYTGLDYFGPMSVTVGRQHQKRYVALFTCLTSRAIHLEIAASLSADSAIMALRRFAARRGCPAEIYSDNGTNMHGADREMREAVKEEASHRGIMWRFITPAAPFMGGAWERLVRCVKTTLNTVLHERHPQEEVLATLLCEVEYTVNSRPLTHVSVDIEDEEAITPNHIIFGGSARLPELGSFNEKDVDSKKHWRRAQILADLFWHRWVREYLPELQHRREPHGSAHKFEVGDPVLIADGNLPRNTWPRGRITTVYPGADGQIRTAEVKTSAGILKRPAKKLIPLPK